jgi:cell wall-associated NlpC family hydrolase
MKWIAKYQNIPFVNLGWDFSGVHCWGLIHLIYKTELNIDLPTYGDTSAKDLRALSRKITNGYDGEKWLPIERDGLKIFDVIVMKFLGSRRIGHVGLYIGNNQVMHCEGATDVAIVPFTHHTVKHRIAAFRRHKEVI